MKKPSRLQTEPMDGIARLWRNAGEPDFIREYYADTRPESEPALPLRVNFVHEEHCYANYYRRREASEVFSVELVLEGSMHFTQDGQTWRVLPGEVFLVQLDRENEFATGPEKHCRRLAYLLQGRALNPLLHCTGLFEQNVIRLHNRPQVEGIMRQCFTLFKEKPPEFRRRASLAAYELLLALQENLQSAPVAGLVSRAIELMENHLSQSMSLKTLAAALATSPTTLHREFRRYRQTSPINYFIGLKMAAAQSMLRNTNLQIQEIAGRLGYDNALYFSSEFKKRVGKSPRRFRTGRSDDEKS